MPLEIKDPVFAAYLLSKGCELQGIDPSSKTEPKLFLFDDSVKEENYEDGFYGCGCPKEKISWRDFVSHMNRIIKVEDLKLRQMSDRPDKVGIELHKGEKVYVTTDQAIAAFILSKAEDQEIVAKSVQMLGRDKGYKFVFIDKNNWTENAVAKMLEGDNFVDTWWNMKSSFKLATSIRRRFTRDLRKDKNE